MGEAGKNTVLKIFSKLNELSHWKTFNINVRYKIPKPETCKYILAFS